MSGECSLEQCVELCELADGNASKLNGCSDAVIHDINLIVKEEIKYLEERRAQLLQELKKHKKIVTELNVNCDSTEQE